MIEFFIDGVTQGSVTGEDGFPRRAQWHWSYCCPFSDVIFDRIVLTASRNAFEHAVPIKNDIPPKSLCQLD